MVVVLHVGSSYIQVNTVDTLDQLSSISELQNWMNLTKFQMVYKNVSRGIKLQTPFQRITK
jgi:hypothetical protein